MVQLKCALFVLLLLGLVVTGLSYHQPDSAGEILDMLERGNGNRTQHPTEANATSSRSHAVFRVST